MQRHLVILSGNTSILFRFFIYCWLLNVYIVCYGVHNPVTAALSRRAVMLDWTEPPEDLLCVLYTARWRCGQESDLARLVAARAAVMIISDSFHHENSL